MQNRHQKPLHPLSHQHKVVGVRRGKGTLRGRSPSGTSNRQPCKDCLRRICSKSPCDYWHPTECQFYKIESGCKFGDTCSFAHRQVEGQPGKKPKKDGDNSAVAILKNERIFGLRFSGHRAARIFIDFTEDHKSHGINSTSAIHRSCAASSKHPRQQRTVARKNSSQKFLISAVPTL